MALAWLATACTALNPAYETTGQDETGQDATTDVTDATTTSTGHGATPLESSSSSGGVAETSTEGTTAPLDAESSSDEGIDPPPIAELCLADLYGINEAGEIHLIDVDAGTTVPLPAMPALGSWAIATDPATGHLHVSPHGQPDVLMIVEPVTFELQETLMLTGTGPGDMARAAFDPLGALWLGTYDTNDFFAVSLEDGTSVQHSIPAIGAGGDLLFLDVDQGLVPSLQGDLVLVDFTQMTFEPVPIEGLPSPLLLTGIARDREERLWLGSEDGRLLRIGFGEREPGGAYVDHEIALGTTINDLASVVAEPPGC